MKLFYPKIWKPFPKPTNPKQTNLSKTKILSCEKKEKRKSATSNNYRIPRTTKVSTQPPSPRSFFENEFEALLLVIGVGWGRRVVALSLSLSLTEFKNERYFVTIGLYLLVIRTTLFLLPNIHIFGISYIIYCDFWNLILPNSSFKRNTMPNLSFVQVPWDSKSS